MFSVEGPGLADLQHLVGGTTAEVTLTSSEAEGVPSGRRRPGHPVIPHQEPEGAAELLTLLDEQACLRTGLYSIST